MIVLAGAITLLSWIYLAFGRGGFWRAGRMVAPSRPANLPAASVIAIVPARDEASVVGKSVASLLKQSGVGINVILVDDGSSDGTADVARRAAAGSGHPERLIIIAGQPLPPGWSGKLWAVEQGLQRARELHPDFYLLTDADIEHAPDSVATLAAIAVGGPYDLASFMVMLHCSTLAERALIPAFVFFFFLLYPPAWIADRRRAIAGAAGGSILLRPQALERAGGIAAIRSEVIDDCALAKNVKRSGGSVWLGLTRDTRSIRPYGSFAEIGRMISRSAFNQLRHSALMLILSFVGMALAYLAPPLLAIFSHRLLPALLGAAAWMLMSICYWPIIRFYRLNLLWSVTLPLAALFYMGATFHSAWKYWLGRGGEWKGRVQDPARD